MITQFAIELILSMNVTFATTLHIHPTIIRKIDQNAGQFELNFIRKIASKYNRLQVNHICL